MKLFYMVLYAIILGARATPNFLIILTDDLGYGDIDHPGVDTPHLRTLRDASLEFTQAYSADSVCTPSRAAFLTGRYPVRSGMANDFYRTLYGPGQSAGLPRWTVKFPQLLKHVGYSTALVGKWHLGINSVDREDGYYLPHHSGFDHYYGLPMGNTYMCEPGNQDPTGCFLYNNLTIVEQPIITETIAERLLSRTLDHLTELPQPFLLQYWTIHTHTPLFPVKQNRSRRGLYGDALMELDDQIGEIMAVLPPNTYVIFTSDNGPYAEEFPHNGSPGPFKGSKGQVYEGGIRVPFYIYHPDVPPRRVHDVISLMDVFPTLLELANITHHSHATSTPLDGASLVPFLTDEYIVHDRFIVHYCGETPIAVRYGVYKIFYAEQIWSNSDAQTCPGTIIPVLPYEACGCEAQNLRTLYPPKIYNIDLDPQEKFPLNAYEHMAIIETASAHLEEHIAGVIEVENQLNAPLNETLAPCCNYPACFCVEKIKA